MNESEAVILVLDTLEDSLSVPVYTAGGHDSVEVPGVVIEDWNPVRLPTRNGARNFAGIVTDATGAEIASEHHIYYRISFNIVARHEQERGRDELLTQIRRCFATFEDDVKSFHSDVSELEVGNASPRALPFREPDWYQGGVELSFVFVDRIEIEGDTLEAINRSVSVREPSEGDEDDDVTWIGRSL